MQEVLSREVLSRNNEHSADRDTIRKKALIRITISTSLSIICCLLLMITIAIGALFLYIFGTASLQARNSIDEPILSDAISCTVKSREFNCTDESLDELLEAKESWTFGDFFDKLFTLKVVLDEDDEQHQIFFNGTIIDAEKVKLKICHARVNYTIDGNQQTEETVDTFIYEYSIEDGEDTIFTEGDEKLFTKNSTSSVSVIPPNYLMFSQEGDTRTCYIHPLYRNLIGFSERTIDYYYPGRSSLTSACGYIALAFMIVSGGVCAFLVIPLTVFSVHKCISYKRDVETMEHMEMNDQESEASDSGSQVSDDGRRYF
ncbi:hypothetical protein C9374_010733 [Naegleria lovaniensis]|uniref:Uncharacterized protein n=1 Tax=Naegleria lovaniensis TaxID=51637 RepID=A0AA88KFD6_NAELO|nr:uncharacterized protein C9374_010733 [Naegleria lovaniensis]KAG2374449.1 hypothetical protein C9374_010733 [Naegleria lovaniensis]